MFSWEKKFINSYFIIIISLFLLSKYITIRCISKINLTKHCKSFTWSLEMFNKIKQMYRKCVFKNFNLIHITREPY